MSVEALEWVSADGDVLTFEVMRGVTGRFMPPIEITEDTVPGLPGGRFRGARHATREVVVPVYLEGPVADRDALRSLARALDPAKGIGKLRTTGGPAPGRELSCVYVDGLQSLAEEYPRGATPSLLFHAHDPYWHESSEASAEYQLGQAEMHWFTIFPLMLGASEVFAEFDVDNNGDVEAWPLFTVIGPGDSPMLTNMTSDKMLSYPHTLGIHDIFTADFRPGYKRVLLNGISVYKDLDPLSELWPLLPGTNHVRVGMVGADYDNSRLQIQWRRQWLTA